MSSSPSIGSYRCPEAIDGAIELPRPDETLYRSAFVPMLSLILGRPLLRLGRARCVSSPRRPQVSPWRYTLLRHPGRIGRLQLQLTDAALLIDTAHLHAYRAAADIDETALGAPTPTIACEPDPRRHQLHRAEGHPCDRRADVRPWCRQLADVNPLQRIWRDAPPALGTRPSFRTE